MLRVALVAAMLQLGCASGGAETVSPLVQSEIVVGDETRTYHVMLPDDYDASRPVPLVLAFHGGGGSGARFDRSAGNQLRAEADRRDWIVVFPEGVNRGWNDGREATAEPRRSTDDVAFVAALLDRLATDYAVDRSRVYATGISNGGFMSIRLALDLADRIAAVAPVTASLQVVHAEKVPARPVPIMFVNGTEDPLVPYEGGHVRAFRRSRGEVLSTDASAQRFGEMNGCARPGEETTLEDRDPTDGTRVHVRKGTACKAPVVVMRIEGGGHTWPGGSQYLPESMIGRVSRDIDGTHEIFEFFAAHRLP